MTLPRQALFMLLALGMLPAAGHAQCRFQQPHAAEVFRASLVPAFAPCEPTKLLAESDIQACEPVALTDAGGWTFDPASGQGKLELNVIGGDGNDEGDVLIALGLSGMREGQVPAAGQGTLRLHLRLTLDHPQSGDLTLPDTALEIPFEMTDGSATLETSLNAVLAELEDSPGRLQGMPSCFIAEVLGVEVLDENRMLTAPVGLGWYGGRY